VRILVLPADLGGCGYYRLLWAAEHLQSQGHDIVIEPPEEGTGLTLHLEGYTVTDVVAPEADVVVMQRIAHFWHPQALPILRAKGVATVIDMDDDLTCIHRDNTSYANYHPRSNTPFSWKFSEMACREASLVTLSTASLLKVYAKHGRGAVLDNYVPERYLDIKVDKEPVFGWAGMTTSHPGDLQVCGRAVQDLIQDGYDFRVIGPPSKVKQNLRLNDEPAYTGKVPIENWTTEISKLAVSMCPLEISPFNASKSRLKAVEAAAVGVPWVGSPRTEYRRFHKESGTGILADRPKDWYQAIKKLMDDDSLRQEMGEAGREYMRSQTIEKNSWRWLEAWTRAYDIQRGSKAGTPATVIA
jgi:glycosyltransferase involved in cell wall biosynthesis